MIYFIGTVERRGNLMSVPKGTNPVVPRDPVGQRRPFIAVAILFIGLLGGAILWQMRPRDGISQPKGFVNSFGVLTKSAPQTFVRMPRMRRAADVTLADETTVVGVVVAGKPRAYNLGVFRWPNYCVINDLINDIPITVAYHEAEKTVRVYTDRYRGSPLELENSGHISTDGKGGEMKMMLNIREVFYLQESGEPADKSDPTIKKLATYPFEQMSWKEWKEAHPSTEIYTRSFGAE